MMGERIDLFKMWKYTHMLKMNMSLTGNVIHNIPDILLPATTDEVLLRGTMLEKILSEILSSIGFYASFKFSASLTKKKDLTKV